MDYTVRDKTYRRLVQISRLHYTVKSHHLQWNVRQLCQICHHFYSICHLFPCGQLLERSRFNRRSKQLIWLVQLIRKSMSEMLPSDKLAYSQSQSYHF